MLSLSASHPTVSATTSTRLALRLARRLHHRLIDALDEIVPTLIELVDVAFRRRNLMIVFDARLVLLVPQLDVRLRQARDQHTDGLVHLHLVRAVEPPKNLPRWRGARTGPGAGTACEKRAHGLENLRRSDLRRERQSSRIVLRHDAEVARAVGAERDDGRIAR